MKTLSHHLTIELLPSKATDFHQFLTYHQKIKSFQRINNTFYIKLKSLNQQEYFAFLHGLKEIFQIKRLKECLNCQATCRDGTLCLNRTSDGTYCWKHKNSKKSFLKKR